MTRHDKIGVLADAAKYDASCSTSGSARDGPSGPAQGGLGSTVAGGICHSWSADGRCVALLKVLLSNVCCYDCAYCANRRSRDTNRATFEPEELVRLIVEFYRRNYIEGAFLSSGVLGCPDATMERLIHVARTLRQREGFRGYIHLKIIPGASPELVLEAARWADRVSVNIEMPSAASLARIAPDKKPAAILGPMRILAEAAGFEPRKALPPGAGSGQNPGRTGASPGAGTGTGIQFAGAADTMPGEGASPSAPDAGSLRNNGAGDSREMSHTIQTSSPAGCATYLSSPEGSDRIHHPVHGGSGIGSLSCPSPEVPADLSNRSRDLSLPVSGTGITASSSTPAAVSAWQSLHRPIHAGVAEAQSPTFGSQPQARRLPEEPQPLPSDAMDLQPHSVMDARRTRLRNPGAAILPAGQTTQMVVGASPEPDSQILALAENLYLAYDVRRVYYSAFLPAGDDPRVPALARPPLAREHRLYQADWLFRFYGFAASEILEPSRPWLDLQLDPKSDWALRHPELFPVDVCKAEYRQLLRVPGIGPKAASRIVGARRLSSLSVASLPGMGVVMRRARWFITVAGRSPECPSGMGFRGGRSAALDHPELLRHELLDPAFRSAQAGQLEFDWGTECH